MSPGAGLRLRDRLRRFDLPAWFLLLGAVFGVGLVFFVPPSQGLDEPNHFFRAYGVTHGRIVAPIVKGRARSVVPACTFEYVNDQFVIGLHTTSFQLGDFWKTPAGCDSRPEQVVPIENTAVNSPVSYLPAEATILVLRLLGAPVPVIFFAGRLAGLAVYLALIYLAIRVAPRGKAVFFVIALLPSSLGLASAYSADGLAIGLALLSVALALRCLLGDDAPTVLSANAPPGSLRAEKVPAAVVSTNAPQGSLRAENAVAPAVDRDDRTGWRWFLALAATLLALAVTKNTYFVLAPLILLVPARRLSRSPRAKVIAGIAKAATLAAVAVAAGAWYLAVRSVSLSAYAPEGHVIDPDTQIAFIFHHPFGYGLILARSMFQAAPESTFVPGFVQSIGFFRASARGTGLAPIGLVIIATLILSTAYRSELGPRRDGVTWRDRAEALLPLALAAISVVAIFSALWWQWTPVAALTVRDVQGRYFLPLSVLPLITIALLRVKPSTASKLSWVLIGTIGMLLYTAVKIAVFFY